MRGLPSTYTQRVTLERQTDGRRISTLPGRRAILILMRLFISHASEDKDFVRPLAEALRPDFEVWYDEYKLTLGDSLLAKIDEGLASCDYGVVVLSPSFLRSNGHDANSMGCSPEKRPPAK
jgi:hypothetical protein